MIQVWRRHWDDRPNDPTPLPIIVALVMEDVRFDEFHDRLVQLIPPAEVHVMTIAQQLEARGHMKALRSALLAVFESRTSPSPSTMPSR